MLSSESLELEEAKKFPSKILAIPTVLYYRTQDGPGFDLGIPTWQKHSLKSIPTTWYDVKQHRNEDIGSVKHTYICRMDDCDREFK